MGYLNTFINNYTIDIPQISKNEKDKFLAYNLNFSSYYLEYSNYSLLINPKRKFPYYTAANVNGKLFKPIKRKELFNGNGDYWKKDKRIPNDHQLGHELYKADKSDFDKGHLTKREDVQWGNNIEDALKAAESTYFFTNAIPQVDKLNRGIWRRIEDYILHHQTIKNGLKINLFTGPVFLENDPEFVTRVNNNVIKLPYLFWKVIYYENQNTIYRTAFLTSQKRELKKRRIVKPEMRGHDFKNDLFMTFKDAKTYQVRVEFIEKITNLKFTKAAENFREDTPEELIISSLDFRSDLPEDISKVKVNIIL